MRGSVTRAPPTRPSGRHRLPTAFPPPSPQATVEFWAVDEQRIGLKPIVQNVWCFDSQRPLTLALHRDQWHYLVGFVHPASGRNIVHLASSVTLPLSASELAAFVQAVGAGCHKQIVLVLDMTTTTALDDPSHDAASWTPCLNNRQLRLQPVVCVYLPASCCCRGCPAPRCRISPPVAGWADLCAHMNTSHPLYLT